MYLATDNRTYTYALREGDSLASPFLCGVRPVVEANLSSLMSVRWTSSDNETIATLDSEDSSKVKQCLTRNMAGLYIKKAPSRNTTFKCVYTWRDQSEKYFYLDVILIHTGIIQSIF